jgi:hypothetical protein
VGTECGEVHARAFQTRDQCIRLLLSLFRSSSGVSEMGQRGKCISVQIHPSPFKAITDGMHNRIQNMSLLQTCPHSRTAGQQSGGSAAAVDDSAQKCTVVAMIARARRLLCLF